MFAIDNIHLLNIAIQGVMTEIEPLHNALQTIQTLYNFIEGSLRRHTTVGNGDHFVQTLKSLSVTRSSCHLEAIYMFLMLNLF